MNPLHPRHMKPLERRAALCKILALGLIRLRMREKGQVIEKNGEFLLHSPPDLSGHATPTHKETA